MATINELEKTTLEKAAAYHEARDSANIFLKEFTQKAWRTYPATTNEPPATFAGKFFEDWHAARGKEQSALDEFLAAWRAEKAAQG